ncbi:MAG: hypothetical protein QXR30_03045 [Candidatus Woesearchaeota archaeon]
MARFTLNYNGFFQPNEIKKTITSWLEDNEIDLDEQKIKVKPNSYELKIKFSRDYSSYIKMEGEVSVQASDLKKATMKKDSKEVEGFTGYLELSISFEFSFNYDKPFKNAEGSLAEFMKNKFKEYSKGEEKYMEKEEGNLMGDFKKRIKDLLNIYN